ncbi:hypothetical protein [Cupriavidus sp. HPC(L)]|uniref:hypothetical protein n=1 Tax=Cupriavidus sp. HPC(L) TaxID=1217418 RepID=UPI0012EE5BF8|nr:hypothetical protein [Cupriavidus sp. HPC(L)]
MLGRTVGELRSPLLSDMQRAQALGALAGRLPSLDGGIVSAARDVLLDQIAQLAVPLRAQPLDGVMQGLARCHQSVVHEGGAWPLLMAARTVAPARRGEALIACLRIPSMTRSAMPNATQWIDEALSLPAPERGALLAQVVRRFSFGSPMRTDARLQQFMRACQALRMPNGEPAAAEQAVVLIALADALDHHLARQDGEDEAAHDVWRDLLAAAQALRPDCALDVMAALAGPGALRGAASGPLRWAMLWQAGRRFGAESSQYARWLAALSLHHGWVQPEGTWQCLFDAAVTLPPRETGPVVAMLARGAAAAADRADRHARWLALYQMTLAMPLPEARTAPLVGLAEALLTEDAAIQDERWRLLVDAMPALPRAAQFRALLACIDFGTAEPFWAPCRRIILRLPAAQRGVALSQLADRIVQLQADAHRVRAWRDIAHAVNDLPPEHRQAPWQMLLRRMNRVFERDPVGHGRARDTLADLLAGQPAIARQQCLLSATWRADPRRCEWIVAQARDLPPALQAEVLARVARAARLAGTGHRVEWGTDQRIAVWVDLVGAVKELPTHYRGAPLQQLAQLLAKLPPDMRRTARRYFVALLRGVPPADMPAGFAAADPFAESAMVRRALKRPRYPLAMQAVAPKRARIDETWP